MSEKISIVIPAYNRAAIITATLDSILRQTFRDWECIVVDDSSVDDTKSVVQHYVALDSRFRLLSNERKKGAQGARNTGILNAQFDWIICFDSDNTMHPDMLEKLVRAIREDIDVVQCFSNVLEFKTGQHRFDFTWVSEGNIHRDLFSMKCYVDFNQAIMRRSKLLEIGLLDEDCPSMQEWDTHIRLSNVALYTTVQDTLLDYYIGASDAITSNLQREVNGRMYVLKKHQREWKANTEDLKWMVNDIYGYIRANQNVCFSVRMVFRLMSVTWRIIPAIIIYRTNCIKRNLKL